MLVKFGTQFDIIILHNNQFIELALPFNKNLSCVDNKLQNNHHLQ